MVLFTLKRKSQSFAMETETLSFGLSQFCAVLIHWCDQNVCWNANGIIPQVRISHRHCSYLLFSVPVVVGEGPVSPSLALRL